MTQGSNDSRDWSTIVEMILIVAFLCKVLGPDRGKYPMSGESFRRPNPTLS
jgi:hypothetical protein